MDSNTRTWPLALLGARRLRVVSVTHAQTTLDAEPASNSAAFRPRLTQVPIALEDVTASPEERGGIWFRFFNSCNLRCSYCDEPTLPADPVNAELALATLGQLRRQGFDHITLSGGEPTLLRQLPRFVRQLRNAGFAWISVATNGYALREPAFAEALVDAGVRELYVSVHGADAEAAATTTGKPAYWETLETALANVQSIAGPRIHLGLNHVITTLSIGKLADLAQLARRYGARSLQLSLMEQYVPGHASTALMPRLSDFTGELPGVRDLLQEAGISFSVESIPPCHLLGLESHYLDFRRSRTSHARVVYQSDGEADVVQLTRGASRDMEKVFSSRCDACLYRSHCCGIHHSYMSTHGAGDLMPVGHAQIARRQENHA